MRVPAALALLVCLGAAADADAIPTSKIGTTKDPLFVKVTPKKPAVDDSLVFQSDSKAIDVVQRSGGELDVIMLPPKGCPSRDISGEKAVIRDSIGGGVRVTLGEAARPDDGWCPGTYRIALLGVLGGKDYPIARGRTTIASTKRSDDRAVGFAKRGRFDALVTPSSGGPQQQYEISGRSVAFSMFKDFGFMEAVIVTNCPGVAKQEFGIPASAFSGSEVPLTMKIKVGPLDLTDRDAWCPGQTRIAIRGHIEAAKLPSALRDREFDVLNASFETK